MSQNQLLDSVAEFAPYKILPQTIACIYSSPGEVLLYVVRSTAEHFRPHDAARQQVRQGATPRHAAPIREVGDHLNGILRLSLNVKNFSIVRLV